MARTLIFSDDLDWGEMYKLMFSKIGQDSVHVNTVAKFFDEIENKQVDMIMMILEGSLWPTSDDWRLLINQFSTFVKPIPIITVSRYMNEELENYCNQLKVRKNLIFPCDISREIAGILEDLERK